MDELTTLPLSTNSSASPSITDIQISKPHPPGPVLEERRPEPVMLAQIPVLASHPLKGECARRSRALGGVDDALREVRLRVRAAAVDDQEVVPEWDDGCAGEGGGGGAGCGVP